MTITLVESLPLARFIYDQSWTSVKGTYLYPLKLFARERLYDPNDYLEVIRVVEVDGTDVAITRGGGLFVRDHGISSDRLADLLNVLLCELAFRGLVSQPITDTDIQSGKLIGRHASITGGWGSYAERTWGPYTLLTSPVRDMGSSHGLSRNDYWPANFYWTIEDPAKIEGLKDLATALQLRSVSSTLPILLVAAAYHTSRHNVAETILSCWIISEELLSSLWERYLNSVSDAGRRKRLGDTRTYTAAVRAEILLTAGLLPVEAYDILQKARRVRNDLAHLAAMSQEAAATCVRAMRAMLTVFGLPPYGIPDYSSMGGGIGPPAVLLEPEFPFR